MHPLIDHGRKNVWCSLGMDYQTTFQLARLTRAKGVKGAYSDGWSNHTLPKRNVSFHCFMLGHVPKIMLGFSNTVYTNNWYRINDLMCDNSVILNIHFGTGLEIPREAVYFLITENRGIIFAIESYSSLSDIGSGLCFLRIYKNTYFESKRCNPNYEKIVSKGISNFNANQLSNFISEHNNKNIREYGAALACVRGYWYYNLDSRFISEKDFIDSVFDGSILDILPLNINSLKTFVSLNDKKNKYLIHLPKIFSEGIMFYDDVEFLIGHVGEYSSMKAIRLPSNNSYVRQVTHNDFSVSVDSILMIHKLLFKNIDIKDMKIFVITRNSGYDRPLWYVSDKIRALYKLEDNDIENALLGIDSNVSFWRADYLETGSYAKLMSAKSSDIDLSMVTDCYGLRGISKALSDTPIKTDAKIDSTIDLPINFRDKSLIIEYNSDGTLSDTFQVEKMSEYGLTNKDCPWIEIIKGLADNNLYWGYGESSFEIDPKDNYKFYKIERTNDGERPNTNLEWKDVTDSGEYVISDNLVTWNIAIDEWFTCAMGDGNISWVEKRYDLPQSKFFIRVGLYSKVGEKLVNEHIHFNHYRVWLNGRALIRNIDFKISDKGQWIYIVNKEYISELSDLQHIIVIGDGVYKNLWFAETGYVTDGYISFNNRYDYYDDRQLRVIVDGRVFPIDVVSRPEENGLFSVSVRNGAPYIVENINPALKDPQIDYDSLKDECDTKEKVVNDYLTIKLPQNVSEEFNTIINYYTLYSPFMASIIFDFNNNNLVISDDRITDEDLDVLIKNYKYLLEFDPSTWNLDKRYIRIHPHPFKHTLSVSQRQYTILERLNDVYLKNVADLTPFLQIEA